MQKLPDIIVRARMRHSVSTAEPHPDADLLTAFAEQSIAGRERDQVLEHLSRCGECRDVVAFALPATESAALATSHSPARIGWLSWPVLRWGIVAAGVVAITSFGILQYRIHYQEQTLVASRSVSEDRLPEAVGQSPSPSHSTTPVETAAPRTEMRKQIEMVKKAPAHVRETLAANQPPSAPDARFSQHAPALPTPAAVEVSPQSSGESAPDDQLQIVGKAKPVSPQAPSIMVPWSLPRTQSTPMNGSTVPRWTISASGTLQRSLDGGKTWLDVDVASDSASANLAEVQPSPAPRTVFRAVSVSSNADEVWAGGSGGFLYHTIDAGNRWTRVVPSDGGVLLAGDVVSIQFSDPLNGSVTTSRGEVWTTVDAGQTWHKHP